MTNASPWWRGTRGEWWVVSQVVLLVAIGVLPPAGPKVLSSFAVAAVLVFVGVSALAAGAVALGSSLSMLPRPRDDARLVRRGVYRWVRHPIYTGVILLTVGWALYRGDLLHVALAAGIGAFFVAKAAREERYLLDRFPEYDQYRRRTYRFVPWLY
jgi:protein-S-isoprenylcysteine O-methyltransferase Ste14